MYVERNLVRINFEAAGSYVLQCELDFWKNESLHAAFAVVLKQTS